MSINSQVDLLIVGLGQTGLSCARYLSRQGLAFAWCDTRSAPANLSEVQAAYPTVDFFLGELDWQRLKGYSQWIISPGVAISHPVIQQAIESGVSVEGDIEVFAKKVRQPLIAITGSNGKSTVTTCVAKMVEAAGLQVGAGGNLGVPALDLLDRDRDVYVLELSSFQLETTHSLAPTASVVLNISADHMDRYADLSAYIQAKAKIYDQAAVRVFNKDDPAVMALCHGVESDIFFTLNLPDEHEFGVRDFGGDAYLCLGNERLMKQSALRIPGRHNLANALASLALGQALGLPMQVMIAVLKAYRGLSHRTEFVAKYQGVSFYNDSKATNVGSSIAALEGLHQPASQQHIYLIAGGDAKDADFSEFSQVVTQTVEGLILLGRDAVMIEQQVASSVPVFHATDMQQAVMIAAAEAMAGDIVLLSPACASFDMYSGYVERGNAFVHAVEALVA